MRRIAFLMTAIVLTAHLSAWALTPIIQQQILTRTDNVITEDIPKEIVEELYLKSFMVRNRLDSLESYIRWLPSHIHYKKDQNKDYWSTPIETVQNGYGDCEDLAFLTAAVLKRLGYEPHIYGTRNGKRDHVFTLYIKNGVYHIFDNTNHYVTKAHTLSQIVFFLHKKHDIEFLVELRQDGKAFRMLYTKNKLKQIFG